jgi:enoyl-CoA hydratase/carnithine racemase
MVLGGHQRLPRIVAWGARWAAATGRRITAQEAERIGFGIRVVADRRSVTEA